jgi:hypothetical protein
MISPALETGITSLLPVLDEDIRHLEGTLSRMDTLRSLLIKREEAALEKLLDEIRRQADTYKANEQKRQQLRRDLAADLGCAEGDLTLSKLQRELIGPSRPGAEQRWGAALADRQARLRSLAIQLKREYTLTVLLVRDCLRFNRSLMQAFFGSGGKGGATYSPTGTAKHDIGTMLMSMQL